MLPEMEYICPTQQLHHIEILECACGGEKSVNHKLNSKKKKKVRNTVRKHVKKKKSKRM